MNHLALAILLSNYKGITAILTPQISLCYWLYHFSISHSALAITRCYYGAVILTPQISLCYWLYHFSISHSALAITRCYCGAVTTRCYYGAVTTISSLLTSYLVF